jgi:hypothetical protein
VLATDRGARPSAREIHHFHSDLAVNWVSADALELRLGGLPAGATTWEALATLAVLDMSKMEFTTLPDTAFEGATAMKVCVFPDALTTLGHRCFAGCTGLQTLNLPDSVRRVGDGVFVGCEGLTAISIGDGISDWGAEPFAGCKHTVKELRVRGSSMKNVPGALLHPALAFDAELVVGERKRFGYASSAANMLRPDRVVRQLPGFARQITLGPVSKGCINVEAGVPPGGFTNACYLAVVPTEMSLAIATMAADLFGELGFRCFSHRGRERASSRPWLNSCLGPRTECSWCSSAGRAPKWARNSRWSSRTGRS